LYSELAGRPAALDLADEAALIRGLHRAAPGCSFVHDAAEGGLAVALAEAAIASGIGANLDLPDDALALFGEGGGQAILACPDAPDLGDVPVRPIGSVAGATLLGVPVEQLRQAWEANN
jgi:phosphoribosylformylglycinamidine synthase